MAVRRDTRKVNKTAATDYVARQTLGARALADQIGIGVQSLYQMMRGERCQIDTIKAFGEYFNRPWEEFVEQPTGLVSVEPGTNPQDDTAIFRPLERSGSAQPFPHEPIQSENHLVEEHRSYLAVAPCFGTFMDELSNRLPIVRSYETMSLSKETVRFSPLNRKQDCDFKLRYSTDGLLEVIEPAVSKLFDPASYRRNRDAALFCPDPTKSEPQTLSILIYGGFDRGQNHIHGSYTQAAFL